MNEKEKSLSGEWLFLIFVALFPVLPSYTRMMGQPVTSWITLFVFGILVFLNLSAFRYWQKSFFFTAVVVLFTFLVPEFVHNQPRRMFQQLVEVFIPLLLIFGCLKNNRPLIEKTINVLLAVGFCMTVSGLVECFFGFNVFSLIENYTYENVSFGSKAMPRFGLMRVEQSFNVALSYAIYLSFLFALSFYRYMTASRGRGRYVFLMVLLSANVILTLTRGAALIFVIGFVVMLFANRRAMGGRRFLKILGGLFAVILLAFVCIPEFRETCIRLLLSAFDLLGVSDDTSKQMRESYQARAFEALQSWKTVIFGIGVNELRKLITIDNEWLRVITGYGLFGLVSLAILVFAPVWVSGKKLMSRAVRTDRGAMFFYGTMLVAFLEYAVMLYTVAQMADARIFYLMLGIGICMDLPQQTKERTRRRLPLI